MKDRLRIWWVSWVLWAGFLPRGWSRRSARYYVSSTGYRVKRGVDNRWYAVRNDGVIAGAYPLRAQALLFAAGIRGWR